MCAPILALGDRPAVDTVRFRAVVLTGVATAAAALTAFGLAHAAIITPIWPQLLRGTPFVLAAGLALSWAFEHSLNRRGSRPTVHGVQFGAAMFCTLLPSTALDSTLRIVGLRRADSFETVVAMVLAALSGAALGWIWTRNRAGMLAFAAAAAALLVSTAGPLPVAQSIRGLWLSVAIAPICIVAGCVLAFTRRFLIRGL